MAESLKILIVTTNGYGHLNVGLGLADMLTKKGHNVSFLLRKCWFKNVEQRGYGVRLVEEPELEDKEVDQAANLMKYLDEITPVLKKPTIDQLSWMSDADNILPIDHEKIDKSLSKLVQSENFDLIIVATLLALPSVETCGIPWIYFHTPSPHTLYGNQITPPFSGYPQNTDKEICQKFWDRYHKERQYALDVWNGYLDKNGVGPVNTGYFQRESPYLNVYAYPEALDYRDIATLPETYYRMDNAIREADGTLTEIPEEFLKRPGKLIYIALGSWFSGIVEIMQKLVDILSKTPHKYIVSKGPNHEKYELAENMWGQRFVNQLQILPMVDLVITHGGNNSTVECIHFGKPMIVLPCFIDQHDNAQRIHEKGLGVKFNPFDIQEKSLIETIDRMLNDSELYDKVKQASESMRNSETREKLVNMLETIAKTKKSPFDKTLTNGENKELIKEETEKKENKELIIKEETEKTEKKENLNENNIDKPVNGKVEKSVNCDEIKNKVAKISETTNNKVNDEFTISVENLKSNGKIENGHEIVETKPIDSTELKKVTNGTEIRSTANEVEKVIPITKANGSILSNGNQLGNSQIIEKSVLNGSSNGTANDVPKHVKAVLNSQTNGHNKIEAEKITSVNGRNGHHSNE